MTAPLSKRITKCKAGPNCKTCEAQRFAESKKITDTERLDWLQKEGFHFILSGAFDRSKKITLRQAIDAALRRTKKRG